jgi:predicted AlkP superfamily phosphohydrolase/phosphomutase
MSERRRVLVLGLDGAEWNIIDPLLEEGGLPALAQVIGRGVRAPLESCIPPLSAPAWVTFLLGAGPGRHGVTDFVHRDARLYEGSTGRVTTSGDFPKQTLFDAAGWAGLRVASVAVPMTYPWWPVNGVMVAGGFVPGGRLAVSPSELSAQLDVGRLDLGGGNRVLMFPPGRRVEALDVQLDRYVEMGRRVVGLEPFDLTMAVVHTPDNAHHCFWPTDGSPAFRDRWIGHFYERVDRYLEEMLALDSWDLVVIMSDHGGGPRPARRLAVNRWLADLGLLVFRPGYRSVANRFAERAKQNGRLRQLVRTRAPGAVRRAVSGVTQAAGAIDWARTRAYGSYVFQPYFGVEVNVAGRQPFGVVDPSCTADVVDEVVGRLRSSAASLDLPVRDVLRREEAFGPHADPRLPDVVLQLADDVEGSNSVEGSVLTANGSSGPHDTLGYHSRHGILVMAGEGVRRGDGGRAGLQDVAPTVLSYLGVPLPETMDGTPLGHFFEEGYLTERRVDGVPEGPPSVESGVSVEEEREIIESLRGLGYLE